MRGAAALLSNLYARNCIRHRTQSISVRNIHTVTDINTPFSCIHFGVSQYGTFGMTKEEEELKCKPKHALFLCCGEIYQANTVNWATCVAACDLSLHFCWRHFSRPQSCFHIQVVFIFYILQISSVLFSSKQVTIHRVGEKGQTPLLSLGFTSGLFLHGFQTIPKLCSCGIVLFAVLIISIVSVENAGIQSILVASAR